MWINKFGILAINQKSPKDITEGILLEFTIYILLANERVKYLKLRFKGVVSDCLY
jgi:hypothetical protein